MDDQCLVLSGDWVCGDEGKWDFVIEKNQMGRMVEIHPGLGFKELEDKLMWLWIIESDDIDNN